MKINVDKDSKAFAGGGFLAYQQANRLLGGKINEFIDEACPNEGVPTSKRVELLVGQTIHGFKSTRTAWRNAQQTNAVEFVDAKLAKQNVRGVYRAIEALGETGAEKLYEKIAGAALEKIGVAIEVVHEDTTSSYFTGKKADRAKKGCSRDHRPDKPQINFGIIQVKKTGFPSAFVVMPGNVTDFELFPLLLNKAKKGVLIVADRGPSSRDNKKLVKEQSKHYLFGERSTQPVRRRARAILPLMKTVCSGYSAYSENVDGEWRHYFLSSKTRCDVRATRARKAEETLAGYELNLRKHKRKRSSVKRSKTITAEGENVIIEREVITKRLASKSVEELRAELTLDDELDGVFVLSSDVIENPLKALKEYKGKDEVEKVFCALKGPLHSRPFNARKKECVDGTIFITTLSLLVVSVLAFHANVKHVAVKTLVEELRRVTLIVCNAVKRGLRSVNCVNLTGLARELLKDLALAGG